MAREFDAYYRYHDPVSYAVNRPVNAVDETFIAKNQNWIAGRKLVPIVAHIYGDWAHADTAADGSTYWTVGSWRRRVQKDFVNYKCVVFAKNANDTETGRVQFKVVSSGTVATVTVPANNTGVGLGVSIAIDPAQSHETIEVAILDPHGGNDGQISIRSVMIYTEPLGSPLAAGVKASGFAPIDTGEVTTDSPLTTYVRTQQFDNCDSIYKTRVPTTVLSYAQHYDERDNTEWLYRVQSASYQLIAKIPVIDIPQHCTKLGWAVQGWRSGGSGGKVKLVGLTANSVESTAFSGGWSYGVPNSGLWQTQANCLTVNPGTIDVLDLYIKSDGTNYNYLAGLNIWMEDCA